MSDETSREPQGLPEAEHRRYGRLFLAVTLSGLLFCAGQGVRWWQEHARAHSLERALGDVYRRALGGEPGRSPYGRLQFELGRLQAEASQRLDLVELLAALSRRAPEGVRIDGVSMATKSGVVSGTAETAADLERYLAALATEGYFDISLKNREDYAEPLRFELDVKARDRAAPPKGEDQ